MNESKSDNNDVIMNGFQRNVSCQFRQVAIVACCLLLLPLLICGCVFPSRGSVQPPTITASMSNYNVFSLTVVGLGKNHAVFLPRNTKVFRDQTLKNEMFVLEKKYGLTAKRSNGSQVSADEYDDVMWCGVSQNSNGEQSQQSIDGSTSPKGNTTRQTKLSQQKNRHNKTKQ
ncbi:MAG: hypothetical protein ACRC46_04145 [Thermoguttaceae bacterium]